jgi:hypothetical protein
MGMRPSKVIANAFRAWLTTARIDALAGVGDCRDDRRRAEGGRPEELVDRDQNSGGQQRW